MLFSKLFVKTLRQPPKDETSVNARLLEQAGFVKKMMSGVYAYLPLGYRVLQNIMSVIREEMNALGAQEIYMPALQSKELWDKTNRWKELSDIMYQFSDHSKREVGLATTHEEVIAYIAANIIGSYRDLPMAVYQIQDKFRYEPRAKSGLIRGREFSMKDLYSFHVNQNDCDIFYERVAKAYGNIFSRVGVTAYKIEASGGSFSKSFSHEFQVISDAGEDKLILCPKGDFAQNVEVAKHKDGDPCPVCGDTLTAVKGIEVGNIFKLGTKFSEKLGASYVDSQGKAHPAVMASYGIGPGRLMGTIVEVSHDDRGMIWPRAVTPYHVHWCDLLSDGTVPPKHAKIINRLEESGLSVLYDDRDGAPGVKLHDADLIGIPVRLVTSKKTGDMIEVTYRGTSQSAQHSVETAVKEITKFYA